MRAHLRLCQRCLIAAAFLAAVFPAAARNPNYKLCFRQFTGVPFSPSPPTIDGKVDGDLGWTNAFRYTLGNGTPFVDGAIQGIKDGSNLYLSFEVYNDSTFDNEDAIVIAIDPTGVESNRRRIHIYPVFPTGAGTEVSPGMGAQPREIQYWVGNGPMDNWPNGVIVNPPWLWNDNVRVSSASAGSVVSYFVEVKIPITTADASVQPNGVNIPAAGDFGLYFNIFAVNSGGTTPEHYWPPDAPLITGEIEDGTPNPNDWGNATRAGTSCNGVSFAYSDIFVNDMTNPSLIRLTTPNVFNVAPKNNMVSGTGAFIPAPNVQATLKIANFGLPSPQAWQPIPPPGSHLSNVATIPAATGPATPGTTVLTTAPWSLTAAQQTTYNTPTTRHQCVLAELTSTSPDVLFVNRSAWRNMNFGTASTFEHSAQISTEGYKRPESGRHEFELLVMTKEELLKRGEVTATHVPPQPQGWLLTWVAHGFRSTDDFVIINRKRFRIQDRVGSFGFFITHAAADRPERWDYELRGTRKVPERPVFRVSVAHGQAAELGAVVRAVEKGAQPPRNCFKRRQARSLLPLAGGLLAAALIAYRPRRRRR